MQDTDHQSALTPGDRYLEEVRSNLDIRKLRTIRFALEAYSDQLYSSAKKSHKVVSKTHLHHEDLHYLHTILGEIHGLLFEIHFAMEKYGVDA